LSSSFVWAIVTERVAVEEVDRREAPASRPS
jgi:hypothetical protein